MILTGSEYLKAINDVVSLQGAAQEMRNALASLGYVPKTEMVQAARENLRGALGLTEYEIRHKEAQLRIWESSPAAKREADTRWQVERLLDGFTPRAQA